MKSDQHRRKYLSEYQSPEFTIKSTNLAFELDEKQTRVISKLQISRQTDSLDAPLVLDGIGLTLLNLNIDGTSLHSGQYDVTE